MQTLVFNSTNKTVKVYEGQPGSSQIIYDLTNTTTVKVMINHYEVVQKDDFDKTYPVLRLPISNTNMVISR